MTYRRTLLRTLVAAGATSAMVAGIGVHEAAAQAFPSKPIRLLIGAPPGGGTDAIGRVVADALAVTLKQPVVVENRPGASGMIASEAVARSPGDGYTLTVVQNGHTVNPATIRKLPYDTLADFTPIAPLARSPLVLVSSSASGVKSMKELAELGKRTPAALSFATAETSSRLAIEMIAGATALPLNPVNYKGTGPAVTDVAGGHVNFTVTTIASTLSQKGTGKIHYVGALAPERSPFLPEVPTLTEQGVPDIEAIAWWGILGPANMPRPVVQALNAAVRTALANPEVKKRLDTLSVEAWNATPEDLDKFIRKEVALTLRVAKKAGIEPE